MVHLEVIFLHVILLTHIQLLFSMDKVEVFYVNLARSKARNRVTQNHLNLLGHPYKRVAAINISVEYNITNAFYPCTVPSPILKFKGSILGSKYIQIDSLCVHPENFLKEVAVTLSHIKALLDIISSPNDNPYAVVIEDDMEIAYHIDFDVFATQFPPDFGVIQLFVMNPYEQVKLIRRHKRNKTYVNWLPLFWSTGGYLVNKRVMRPHLERLLEQRGNNVFHIDLIAGSDRIIILGQDKTRRRKLCWPEKCCSGTTFIKKFPCVLTPHGIGADYYIYSLEHGKTFVSTFPMLAGTTESHYSTVSSNHTMDDTARILHCRKYVRDTYEGLIPLPFYANLRRDKFAEELLDIT